MRSPKVSAGKVVSRASSSAMVVSHVNGSEKVVSQLLSHRLFLFYWSRYPHLDVHRMSMTAVILWDLSAPTGLL